MQAGIMACNRLTELLKAIVNPDFYKVFDENKDGLIEGVDSLVSKFNFISKTKIDPAHGQLFSQIGLALGKHSIRKRQKKYFKKAVDSALPVISQIIYALDSVHLINYNNDLSKIKSEYFDNFRNLQSKLQDSLVKLDVIQKQIDELQSVKKEINNLSIISTAFHEFSGLLQQLMATLIESVKNVPDCKKIYSICTKLDMTSEKIDVYYSFLK